jgi:hypothetical protein
MARNIFVNRLLTSFKIFGVNLLLVVALFLEIDRNRRGAGSKTRGARQVIAPFYYF